MGRSLSRFLAALATSAVAAVTAAILSGAILGPDEGTDDSAVERAGRALDRAGEALDRAGAEFEVAVGTGRLRNADPQPDWRPHDGPVPVFRYHVVGEARAGEPAPELFVPPDDFRAQMDWLEAHGYEAVGLETVEAAWNEGGTLPAKPVVLSFDGVAGDLLSVVVPELRRRGWPAVLVLDAEAAAGADGGFAELAAAGWEVEPEATAPGDERAELEAELGAPVRNFAFPPGEFDEATVPALEAAGYEGATMTGGGFAEAGDQFEMPRITIYGLSRVEGFAEAMRSRGEGVGA